MPHRKQKIEVIGVRLSADILSRLKTLSEVSNLPVSTLARMCITSGLLDVERKLGAPETKPASTNTEQLAAFEELIHRLEIALDNSPVKPKRQTE